MADKVFVVSYTDMSDEGLLQHNLYTLPIPDLTNLASKVLTPREAVEQLHNGEIDTEMNCVVYREIGDEEIHLRMGNDDWQEIIINKDLQIHVNTNGGEGYNVDLYAYNEDTPDEERDYDNEFISSCYASYAELNEARQPIEED